MLSIQPVVLLVVCKEWVLCTINFKTRLANYKSHIKRNRRTCGIVNHFLDCHGADHSLLKFKLIDQRRGNLRKCENFWIGMLLTNQRGPNSTHDFAQQSVADTRGGGAKGGASPPNNFY